MLLARPRIRLLSAAATATALSGRRSSATGATALRRGKLECDDRVRRGHIAGSRSASRSGDDDVLRAVFAHVRDRRRVAIGGKLGDPELLTSLRGKRAESPVDGRTDEDQTARGGDASTDVANAALQPRVAEFCQLLVDAERDAPGDLAGICIDGNQLAVRRRNAWYGFAARQLV